MALKYVNGQVVGNVKGGTVLRHAPDMTSIHAFRLKDGKNDLYVEVSLRDGVSYSFFYASEELFINFWLRSVIRRSRNAGSPPASVTWDDRSPEQIFDQASRLIQRKLNLL